MNKSYSGWILPIILSNYIIVAFNVIPSTYHRPNAAYTLRNADDNIQPLRSFPKRSSPLFSVTAGKITQEEELYGAIECIQNQNDDLLTMLDKLRSESLFLRLYSVDMLGSCEYLPQLFEECYSTACEIYPVEEEEVRC